MKSGGADQLQPETRAAALRLSLRRHLSPQANRSPTSRACRRHGQAMSGGGRAEGWRSAKAHATLRRPREPAGYPSDRAAPRSRPARIFDRQSSGHRSCRRGPRTASRSGCRDTGRRSTPPLPTSAIASPSDSMTDAIKKLPLSFTRLAALGVSETTKVFCPMASKSGLLR